MKKGTVKAKSFHEVHEHLMKGGGVLAWNKTCEAVKIATAVCFDFLDGTREIRIGVFPSSKWVAFESPEVAFWELRPIQSAEAKGDA